jgi:hypothetical protein
LNPEDIPAPKDGFLITHFLVVSDQDRSREFYRSLFDGQVLLERDPVIMKVANAWLILNVGGGPTDDKPTVTLTTPPDPDVSDADVEERARASRAGVAVRNRLSGTAFEGVPT